MRFARNLLPRLGQPNREFWRRLDKVAGDLNVVLVVFVVGLATLDFTFLVTEKIVERLPPVTRMVQDDVSAPSALQHPTVSPQR